MKIEDNHYTYRIETKDPNGGSLDFIDIDTVEPLRCAYDVQDELNLETNEHIKRVEEIVLDANSTEFWYVDEARTSDTHLVCYFEEVELMASNDHPMVDTNRSVFEYGKINSNEHQDTNFICTHVMENRVSRLYMSIDKETFGFATFNNETIKQFISMHPVTVWYALRYEVIIPRSLSKGHLLTLDGQTDITLTTTSEQAKLPIMKFNIGDTQYTLDNNPIHINNTQEGTQIRNIVLEGNTPINYARGNGVNTTEQVSDTRYDFEPFYDGQAAIQNTVEGGYVSAKLYGDTMVNIAKPYGESPLLTATNESILCDDLLGMNEEGIVLADGEITEGRIYGDSSVVDNTIQSVINPTVQFANVDSSLSSQATFPYTLNKLPNGVADYIDVVNKVHVQRVEKVVLDGTSTYIKQHTNGNYTLFVYNVPNLPTNTSARLDNMICDKLIVENYINLQAKDSEFVTMGNGDSTQLLFCLSNNKASEVSTLQNYLASNPIKVLYQLATPIYTPLTEEEIAQLPLSAYADGYINLSSDQLTPSFEFRMRASNRYQVDMLETGYYYLNAPVGNVKLGTANVDVQQMPCIVKVDNVGTGDSAYRLGLGGEITDTTPITLAKLPTHRIPTTFTQGMRCGTDFGYWEGDIGARLIMFRTANTDDAWNIVESSVIEDGIILNRIEISSMSLIVEDELDIATGKFTKRVGKVVFDGSSDESWSVNTRDNFVKTVFFKTSLPTKSRENYICINNRLPYGHAWYSDFERLWIDNRNTLVVHTDKAFSVDDFKKYLASNPVTVYYPLEVPEISYPKISSTQVKTVAKTALQCIRHNGYLNPQVKPSHLTYPVPSLVGNRTYTVVHNRKNISGSTKPIELNLGGTVVQLNDASGKTLVRTPSILAHSNLIFIGGESTVDHIMVLDGDWTNKPIEYFENMKGHDTDAIITIIGDGKLMTWQNNIYGNGGEIENEK